jgi:hypothetical protein
MTGKQQVIFENADKPLEDCVTDMLNWPTFFKYARMATFKETQGNTQEGSSCSEWKLFWHLLAHDCFPAANRASRASFHRNFTRQCKEYRRNTELSR